MAFWQVSLVAVACEMDRTNLAQMLSAPGCEECCDGLAVDGGNAMPMTPTACAAHVTSDLQVLGVSPSLDHPPLAAVVLYVPPRASTSTKNRVVPRASAIPPRILLHSFQV